MQPHHGEKGNLCCCFWAKKGQQWLILYQRLIWTEIAVLSFYYVYTGMGTGRKTKTVDGWNWYRHFWGTIADLMNELSLSLGPPLNVQVMYWVVFNDRLQNGHSDSHWEVPVSRHPTRKRWRLLQRTFCCPLQSLNNKFVFLPLKWKSCGFNGSNSWNISLIVQL